MEEIVDALSGVFYIATTEEDQPHVRPFDGATIYNDEIYIGTNNNKAVYAQILKNKKVEIFAMENGTIRFTAEATPVEDQDLNQEIYEDLGKNFTDTSAAIKLTNIKGTIITKMGDKKELNY